jgi:lysyl-tRNA synthetase class 2
MSEESRVRQRYVDLIVRPEARTIARQRVAVVRAVRSALERRGFLEVETPMLQTLAGGAAARPFVTHSNALDADLYLRIAPELFLKRCLVGGFDKVFELNRVFRNEGADSTHSPEFAMLETYQAYGTYDDSAVMTREIIQEVADEAIGTRRLPLPDGTVYDVDGEWATVQMYPSLSERSVKRSPRRLRPISYGRSPIGSESRFRAIVVTGTGNWSRNYGSTPSVTSFGRRPSFAIFPWRRRR